MTTLRDDEIETTPTAAIGLELDADADGEDADSDSTDADADGADADADGADAA